MLEIVFPKYCAHIFNKENIMSIRIMSHNVWNNDSNSIAWQERGEDCSAQARVGGLVRVYAEKLPDIIGFQEMTALMSDLIVENAKAIDANYTLIWGRFTPIMYRSDKLDLIETHFSTYPDYIDGYEGEFNDMRSKSYSSAVFSEKDSGKKFVFTTTHLWWQRDAKTDEQAKIHGYRKNSDNARRIQLSMAIETTLALADKYGCPAFVVGDLNADYNSLALQYAFSCGLKHAHDLALNPDESMGYHWCYADRYEKFYYDKPFKCAIDHILVYKDKEVKVINFARYSPDYYFPISDHSPVIADIELK